MNTDPQFLHNDTDVLFYNRGLFVALIVRTIDFVAEERRSTYLPILMCIIYRTRTTSSKSIKYWQESKYSVGGGRRSEARERGGITSILFVYYLFSNFPIELFIYIFP